MKKLIQIIICTTLLLGALDTIAQRNIAWVHGLDGDSTSWQHYESIFTAELNINSLRTTYNTDFGITHSAALVIKSMNSYYGNNGIIGSSGNEANNPKNMGIGHSMGGMMIRRADELLNTNPKKFGGYVTVTSPNYGAPIANSLLNGNVTRAAQDACSKLSSGPISQIFVLPWAIIPGLGTDYLCNQFIDNDLVQNLLGTPTTSFDLRVGSSAVNSINDYTDNINPSIPRISIWAQENSPVHWRMFSSAAYNNDTELIDKVNRARRIYHIFYKYNNVRGITSMIGGFWNPLSWGESALYMYRSNQWKKGRDWIDNSENVWSSLIKTTRREQQTYSVLVTVFGYEWDGDNTTGSLGLHWESRTRWVSVNYPSDGLLPQYTQELQGIPQENRYQINGANHIQVRNMTTDGNNIDETAIELRKIFNRSDWFHTD